MKTPLQISFRNMTPSDALETKIRQRMESLEHFYDRITSCRVLVELHHRHHHQGNLYHVRVDLKVPGSEIVASREPTDNQSHEDAYVAVRDAFDAARRQLEDHVRQMQGKVKAHQQAGKRQPVE